VAGKAGREDPVLAGQRRHHPLPHRGAVTVTVQQHKRRALPGHQDLRHDAVNADLPLLDRGELLLDHHALISMRR
jgi:hypothetical protein